MKTNLRQLFLGAAVASCLAWTPAAFAQDPTPPPAAPAEKSPAVAPAATEPAAPVAAPAPQAPVPAVAPVEKQEPQLRELGAEAEPPAKATKPGRKNRPPPHLGIQRGGGGNAVVSVGHDSFLAKDHKADAVISIFGSSTSEGEVADAVVSVLGDTKVTGSAGGAAVAVLGNNYVNGKVGDAVVAVLGDVELGPDAVVSGEVVSVGGTVKRDPKAVVHGQVQNVALGKGAHMNLAGLRTWFTECLLLGRPLAFKTGLGWAWSIALGMFALYFLLALIFSGSVDKGVTTLETRPGFSILTAILSILLIPVLIVLLAVTVVGVVAIPFVVLGLFIASLFGKTVMLAWLGRRFTKFFGEGIMKHAAVAVLIGGALTLALYCVPFLGIIVQKSFDLIGLGAVLYALILASKREKPAVPPAPPTPLVTPVAPVASMASGVAASAVPALAVPLVPPPMPMTSAGFGAAGVVAGETAAAGAIPAAAAAMPAPAAVPAAAMPPITATTYPRAGFMIRLAALALDFILIGIIASMFFHGGKFFLLAIATYGAVMWKMKGTTIGGIVCGLKVVRLDGREIDWSTAIVRALGCFLSLAVVGLGFLWVAIDDEKQSWHDKIAGTTVVRLPKGVPLV